MLTLCTRAVGGSFSTETNCKVTIEIDADTNRAAVDCTILSPQSVL